MNVVQLLLIHRIHHGFECLRHQMILPAEPSGSASRAKVRSAVFQTVPGGSNRACGWNVAAVGAECRLSARRAGGSAG